MTDDHLSLDELAELDEALISPERLSAIRAHLHGCMDCQTRADAITATRSVLADLPPVSIPDDVRARLDEALAAEAAASKRTTPLKSVPDAVNDERALPPAADESARSTTVTPTPGSVSRPRFGQPSMAAIAVAATFVLAGGAVVVGHLRHHDEPAVATGIRESQSLLPPTVVTPGTGQGRNFTTTSTGLDYDAANLPNLVTGLLNTAGDGTQATPTTTGSTGGAAGTSGDSNPAPPNAGSAGGASAGGSSGGGNKSSQGDGKKGDKRGAGKRIVNGGSGSTGSAGSGGVTTSPTQPTSTPVAPLATLARKPVPHALRSLFSSRRKILACAATVSGQPGAVPLTVDFAQWTTSEGKKEPAAVFVFKSPNPNFDAVYVTAPACDGTVLTFANIQLT